MTKTSPFSSHQVLMNLRTSLHVLHEPAEQQLRYLASLGLPEGIDELALEFDDLLPVFDQLVESHAINREVAALVHRLDHAFTSMSGPEHAALWTPWALRTAPEWDDIRTLAGRALVTLDAADQMSSVESA